ncbi:MAG: hypothetical protein HKN01_01550 [Acidimicrobiia bacterium]|nr:hypothetical protein [Acidimicrobiia bacterium]
MSFTNTVTFALRVKDGQLAARELDRFGDAADRSGKKSTKAADATSAAWRKTGARMLAAGTLMLTGLSKAARAGEDLAKSQFLTGTVFGDAASKIDEFAKVSAEKLGLSEQAYRQAAGTIGSQIKNLGFDLEEAAELTNKVLTIGNDRAAAFGRTQGEAVNAISGIFRKEFDTIERFGVTITQAMISARVATLGLDDSTPALLRHAEAVAAVDLLTEQTADTIGAYLDPANELARTQAQVRAEFEDSVALLGQEALPVIKELAGGVLGLLNAFTSLDPEVQKNIVRLGILVTAFNFAAGGAAVFAGNVRKVKDGLARFRTTAVSTKLAIAGIGAALAGALIFWDNYNTQQERTAALARDVAEEIKAVGDAFLGQGNFLRQFVLSDINLAEQLAEASISAEMIETAFSGAGGEVETFLKLLNFDDVQLPDTSLLGRLFGDSGDTPRLEAQAALRELFEVLERGAAIAENAEALGLNDVAAAVEDVGDAGDEGAEKLEKFTSKVTMLKVEGKKMADVMDDAKRATREMIDLLFFDDEEYALQAALRDLQEALAPEKDGGSGGSFSKFTDEGYAAAQAFEAAASAAADTVATMALEQNLTPDQIAAAWAFAKQPIIDLARDAGVSEEDLGMLITKMEQVPDIIEVSLEVEGFDAATRAMLVWIAETQANLGTLFITPTIPTTPRSQGGTSNGSTGGSSDGGASGGSQVVSARIPNAGGTQSALFVPTGPGRTTGTNQPITIELDGIEVGRGVVNALNSEGGAPLIIRGASA